MDYHLLTKKCDGMCDSCECPPTEPHPSCKTPAGCRANGCLGWCDEHRPDPELKPDIAALKKRMAEDPAFAAQVTGDRPPTPVGWSDTDWLKHLEKRDEPLRRGVNGVCIRSTCECEREGLGDQCVWLKPVEAEFECLGEPSLCANPRGCACVPDSKTPNAEFSGGPAAADSHTTGRP